MANAYSGYRTFLAMRQLEERGLEFPGMKNFRKIQNQRASSFKAFCNDCGFAIIEKTAKKLLSSSMSSNVENEDPNAYFSTEEIEPRKLESLEELQILSTFKKKQFFRTKEGREIRLSSGSCV